MAGGVLAGGFSLLTGGLRVAGDSVGYWFSVGRAVFQLPLGLSFALVGAGYLVGIVGGVAMLLGVVLSWGVAVPWLTSLAPMPDGASLADFATGIWVSKVRLIGAGVAGVVAWAACRRRTRLAYSLWLLVLIKALVPPLWASPLGVFSQALSETPASSPVRGDPPDRRADGIGAPLPVAYGVRRRRACAEAV